QSGVGPLLQLPVATRRRGQKFLGRVGASHGLLVQNRVDEPATQQTCVANRESTPERSHSEHDHETLRSRNSPAIVLRSQWFAREISDFRTHPKLIPPCCFPSLDAP